MPQAYFPPQYNCLFNQKSYTTESDLFHSCAFLKKAVAADASVTQRYDINVSLCRAAVEDRKS
jgi:hypothetical protein